MSIECEVRQAGQFDAEPMTALFIEARRVAMPWLAVVHSDEETRWWIENVVLHEQDVWVACVNGGVLAFVAISGTWLEHLYVRADAQGAGVGTTLLDLAKRRSPDGLRLRVFERNVRARAFYESFGFRELDRNDGSRNEEGEPDLTYVWRLTDGAADER